MMSQEFTLCALLWLVVLPLVLASIDDGVALIAMKEALNLSAPSWTNGADPCQPPQWEYIYCISDQVTTLNLSGQGLRGSIPIQIGDLRELQALDLQDNNLNDRIPVTIANLRQSLLYLNLSRNNFAGPFPTPVLQLTKLVDLRISDNLFAGQVPADIRNLSGLTILLLGGNHFVGPIPSQSLSSLQHLTELETWGNPFNDPIPVELGLLPRITKLIMHNNGLSGQLPSVWSASSSLEVLEMQWNSLDGPVPESWMRLPSLGSLKQLRLDHNRLEGHFPLWTSSIRNFVDLSCNFFTGTSPVGYSPASFLGNCFDTASQFHSNEACADGTPSDSCRTFPAELPPGLPHVPAPPSKANPDSSRSGPPPAVVTGAAIAVAVATIGAGLVCLWLCKARRTQAQKMTGDDPYRLRESDLVPRKDYFAVKQNLRRFSIRELRTLTKGFSKEHEIGEGSFGKVYYAKLKTGEEVAIKKANPERVHGESEFQNEITLLSQVSHPYLVGIKGFCDERGEQILVYDFMKNGNLLDCLNAAHHGATLDWYRRLEIAVQVAGALQYLHHECQPRIIHRDIKPSNILLDHNMVAKLSDFGISKTSSQFRTHVSTRPAGTNGYLDPDYFLRSQLTTASDVYSFGVVLLELITGQKAIDKRRGSEDPNLATWVYNRLSVGGINAVIDPLLKVQDYPESAYKRLAWLALDCSAPEKDNRCSITVVWRELKEIMETVRKPAFGVNTGSETSRAFHGAAKEDYSDSSNTVTTSTFASTERSMALLLPR